MTGLFDIGFGNDKPKRKGVTGSRRMSIARGQKFQCKHCGRSITKSYEFDIDHIDGDRSNRDITNLQALCKICHSKKSHKQTKSRVKKQREEKDPFGLKVKPTKRKSSADDPLGFGKTGIDIWGTGKPKRKRKSTTKKRTQKKKDDPFGFGKIGF